MSAPGLAQHCPDTLQYDLGWAQSEQGRPLSLSLPFTPGNAPHCGDTAHAFFKNLLPDSRDIRERMARRYKTGTTDAFDLLAEVGRDCAGALEILPMGTSSAGVLPLQAHTLTDAQVAEVLRGTTTPSTLGLIANENDFRICIAGAQELTALLQVDGQWCLPRGATPTTHIFKLPMGLIGGMKLNMTLSVQNEWLCAVVLKAFGLPVAACQPQQFEDMKALVVERFDRAWWASPEDDQRLIRLPQEDMCQATGVPPDAKYEADGGPGIDSVFKVLEGSITREQDRRTFARMAMSVRAKNAHWKMRNILRRHWLAVGARHGVIADGGRPAESVVDDLVVRTPELVAAVRQQLPQDFPLPLADSILGGLQDAANKLAS